MGGQRSITLPGVQFPPKSGSVAVIACKGAELKLTVVTGKPHKARVAGSFLFHGRS